MFAWNIRIASQMHSAFRFPGQRPLAAGRWSGDHSFHQIFSNNALTTTSFAAIASSPIGVSIVMITLNVIIVVISYALVAGSS